MVEIDKSMGLGQVFKSALRSFVLYFIYILIFPLALLGLPVEFIRLGLDGDNSHVILASGIFSLLISLVSSLRMGLLTFILVSFVSLSIVNLYKAGLSLKGIIYSSFGGLILFAILSILIYQYNSGEFISDKISLYYKSMIDGLIEIANISDKNLIDLLKKSVDFMVSNIYGLGAGLFYIGISVNVFWGLNKKEDIHIHNFSLDSKFTSLFLVVFIISLFLSYRMGGIFDYIYTNLMSFISLVLFIHLMSLIMYLGRNMGFFWKILLFVFGLMLVEVFPGLLILAIVDSYMDFRMRNRYGQKKA